MPEPLTIETLAHARQAAEGLAVLAAIPVVLFALWADYLGRHLKGVTKNNSGLGFDRNFELGRVRTAATCVLLFEVILFIGSMDLLKIYPMACAGILLAAIIGIAMSEASLIRFLKTPEFEAKLNSAISKATPNAASNGNSPFRALFFGVIGGLSYIFTLVATVRAFAWIAQAFHFSNAWGAAFVLAGAALGIFVGLVLNFALGPWQIRNSLPVSKLPEGELRKSILEIFEKVGSKTARKTGFEFFVIESETPRSSTALVAGFAHGKGIFKPGIFISRSLLTELDTAEVKAVIAHEAAHVARGHLFKRAVLSASMIVSLTFLSIFAILIIHFAFPSDPAATNDWQSSLGTMFGMFALITTFRTLSRQSRNHETEADWLCVGEYGAGFEAWASALRKIDKLNGVIGHTTQPTSAAGFGFFKTLFGGGHLETEQRIALVGILLMKSGKLSSATPTSKISKDQNQDIDHAA